MKKRDSNIELLRIISMFFIVAYHCNLNLSISQYGGIGEVLNYATGIWGVVGVDIFFGISFYFLQDKEFDKKRLFLLILQIICYAIPFAILKIIYIKLNTNTSVFNILKDVSVNGITEPFWSNVYWFATIYLLMYISFPILNKFLKNVEKNTILNCVIGLTIIIFLFQVQENVLEDYFFAIYIYIVMYYLKNKKQNFIEKYRVIFFIVTSLCIIFLKYYLDTINNSSFIVNLIAGKFGRHSILFLLNSISVFYIFKNWNIGEIKFINRISSTTFGIYLFHENQMFSIRNYLYEFCNFRLNTYINNNYLYHILFYFFEILFLLIIGCVVDLIRQDIFEIISNIKNKRDKYLKKIIVYISTFIVTIVSIIGYYKHENNLQIEYSEINLSWYKYSNYPVLGDEYTGSLFDPFVMKDENGKYRMYVSWRKEKSIAVSESSDGINWSELKIVLKFNDSTGWEDDVNRATVVYKDGLYYMWYTGQANLESKIGYAVSEDGYNFKKYDIPVIVPEYEWEQKSVMNPNVIYDEEEKIYKMWYAAGEDYEPDVIAYATSKDGINWQKYNDNPIIKASKDKNALDNYKIGGCDVHKIKNNSYIIFYIGYTDINTARIFVAHSDNGINNWKRHSNSPIVLSTKDMFDSEACYKPSAVWDEHNFKWMLWYNGRTQNREYIGLSICNKYDFWDIK